MGQLKKSNLVVQSNRLVEARYKLSLNEQKIVFLIISMIKREDKELRIFKVKTMDILKILGIRNKNFHAELKENLSNIKNTEISIERENGYLLTSWFSDIEYIGDSGEIEFSISQKLFPYLIDLKNEFLPTELNKLIHFKSYYAIRIYCLLRQYRSMRPAERTFELEDLRLILGANEQKSYLIFNEFRRNVIVPAQKEMSKKDEKENYISDIGFDFEAIKTGRKITGIKFLIKKQNTKSYIDSLPSGSEASEEYLLSYGISQDKSQELAMKYPEAEIQKCILIYEKKRKDKKVNSGVGLLIYLIESGAGKKTQKEIEEENKKLADEKKSQEKKLAEKKSKIAREFQAKRVAEFIESLGEDEKKSLTNEILKAHEGSLFNTELVKSTGFNSPIARVEVEKHIPNYEEEKQAYINSKL